jgi:hypothetical protein
LAAVTSDPEDEESEVLKEWDGKKFDPKKFSAVAANKNLRPLQTQADPCALKYSSRIS